MAEYHQIDADAFSAALSEWGFAETDPDGERIWQRAHKTPGCVIRVYSSIRSGRKAARDAGTDAIRVTALYQPNAGTTLPLGTARPLLPKMVRVHRVKGWRENLLARCRDAWVQISRIPQCPACGAPTVERTRKSDGDKFRGCVRYPDCKGVAR